MNVDKMIFDTDEIHAVRVDLDERRKLMTPEEARRDYDERIANGKRRIESIREEKRAAKREAR